MSLIQQAAMRIGGAALLGLSLGAGAALGADHRDDYAIAQPDHVSPAGKLLAQRPDCSTTGAGHEGELPATAIVTTVRGHLREATNVDLAIRVALGESDAPLTVHAFCYPTS